jgi:acyl-CoA thioesterase I
MNTSIPIKKIITQFRPYLLLLIGSLCLLPLNAHSDKSEQRILIVGDSISAAYGMDISEGWAQLLQQRINTTPYSHYQVINASISGNTSGDGLSRLPQLLSLYSPSIVVIELGGNDGLRGHPVKLMAHNLQKMINLSQEHNAKVILAGIEIPPNYGERYTQSFRKTFQQLAKNNSTVSFIPFILEGIATRPLLMPILLDNMWGAISELLRGKQN